MKKILVADDDEAIVDALRLMLEDADYTVETTTRDVTVAKVRHIHPDLILLDIWLSGEDGRQICHNLKKQQATKRIPVILISATRDLASSAKNCGADDYIEKPFQMSDLLSKISKHLKN